jgi:hypothetical protein
MNLSCSLGFHTWVGCKCSKCGKTRDQLHDWSMNCEVCSRCGRKRENAHTWNGCKCITCGIITDSNHSWDKCKCTICGKEEHTFDGCKCTLCGKQNHNYKFPDYKCSKCGEVIARNLPDDIIISRHVYDDLKRLANGKNQHWLCIHLRRTEITYYLNQLYKKYEFASNVLGFSAIEALIPSIYDPRNYVFCIAPVGQHSSHGSSETCPDIANVYRIGDILFPIHQAFEIYHGHFIVKLTCILPPTNTWGVPSITESYWSKEFGGEETFYAGIPIFDRRISLDWSVKQFSIPELENKAKLYQEYFNSFIETDYEKRPPLYRVITKCSLNDHQWLGCKCTVCGKTRDEGHDWSKDCEICSICGKIRPDTLI